MITRLCRPVAREIWRELSVAKMSQRSITSFFGAKTNSQKPSNGVVTTSKKGVAEVTECSPLKTEHKRVMRALSDSEEENNDNDCKVIESPAGEKSKAGKNNESAASLVKSASKKSAEANGTLKRKASTPEHSSSKKVKTETAVDEEAKPVAEDEPMSEDEPILDDAVKVVSKGNKKTLKPSSRKSAVLESVGRRRTPSKATVAAKGKKGKATGQKSAKKDEGKTKVEVVDSKEELEGSGTEKHNDENGAPQEDSDEGNSEKKIEENTPATKGKKAKATPGKRKSGASAKKGSGKSRKGSNVGAQNKEVDEDTEKPASKKTTPKPANKRTPAKSKGKKSSGKSVDEKSDSSPPRDSKSEGSTSDTPKAEDSDKKEATSSPNTSVNEDSPMTADEKVSPLNYNSAHPKYHPITHACWEREEKVPYIALARTLEAIENTSARLKRIEILSNLLRSVLVLTPEDLVPCVYLCLNKLAPAYEGVELGVGDMVLLKAVAQSTGRTLAKLRAEVAAKGDLGLVAEASRSSQKMMFKPAPLTVRGVFAKLLEIARMTGNSSMSKKMDKIQSMFVACRGSETRYLIRSLGGKLRIGLAEQSLLAAISQAAVLTPPCQDYPPEIINSSKSMSSEKYKKKLEETSLIVKTTYCECPSYDKILGVLLKEGVAALPDSCHITPGIPMKPMLAHPTKGVSEVLQRFENAKFTCEFKYDGERAQIHVLENGDVHIYSRNQENNTSKYPDVIKRLPSAIKEGTRTCILDSEMVAWDGDKKQILPFQVLSTRKKKDANEAEIKVQVCIYAFDVLYLNGESLVKKPFSERRQALYDAFTEVEGEFTFVKSMDADDTEKIEEFLEESIKGNCEGLMVKSLDVDATYEIAKRSHNWLKLKKDYLEGTGDTLDLVVIGGYHGKGKRTGSYGGFLLACYDETNEEFQSICKLGTGFKDEDLEKHSKFFQDHIIDSPKSYYRYDNTVAPDVWFDAVQVWEIKCADLSVSPVHKAALGLVDPTKGISLRFPRFLRIREDKSSETATNAEQVAAMYNNQEQVKNQQSSSTADAEEEEY